MEESANRERKPKKGKREEFSYFTKDEWERWIWERTHGVDTITGISLVREPYPHLAVIDAYHTPLSDRRRRIFLNALVASLQRSVEECIRCSESHVPKEHYESELLALERHLRLFDRLDSEDVGRFQKKTAIKRIARVCYDFAGRELPVDKYGELKRLALGLRSRLRDHISVSELHDALSLKETFVVAFRHAVRKYDISAVGRFFPQFVETALLSGKRALIKVELMRLLERYADDCYKMNVLNRELHKSISQMPEETGAAVKSFTAELGLDPYEFKPIREVVSERRPREGRKGTLIYLHEGYVKRSHYNQLWKVVVNNLAESNDATLAIMPPGKVRWDYLPSYLIEHLFDFCVDPFFKTGPRSHLVDVVQFGWVESFTCVLSEGSDFLKTKLVDNSLPFQARILDAFRSFEGLQVGVYGETAASMEVLKALHNRADYASRVNPFTSAVQIRHWLSELPQKRIAVCDHGIARDIKQVSEADLRKAGYRKRNAFEWRYISGTQRKDLLFRFSKRIPVGFIYPIKDATWCKQIVAALGDALGEFVQNGWWTGVERELRAVGIVGLDEKQLYKRLGLEKFYREMHLKRLEERLKKAIEQDEFEEAEKMKTQIKEAKKGFRR